MNEYDTERIRFGAEYAAGIWAEAWVTARKRLSTRLRELRQGEQRHFDLLTPMRWLLTSPAPSSRGRWSRMFPRWSNRWWTAMRWPGR